MASKSEMARETGLSFPTVTRIVDTLCQSGEVVELGQRDSSGGRPSVVYGLNARFSLFLLIRIDGSEIFWSVMDLAEETLEAGKLLAESGLIEALDELIRQREREYPAVKAISVGFAGMVADGTVVESYLSAEVRGINFLKHFKNLTDTPVQVHNDMNLIALGGWYRSKEKPSSSVSLYLGKATVGAGLVLGGEVWTGAADFAGELGFLPFQKSEINDFLEYYVMLIRTYAVILNPERIVLYENPYIRGRGDEIRKRCAQCLPEKGMPEIGISDEYETDYETGLYAMAKKIMEG